MLQVGTSEARVYPNARTIRSGENGHDPSSWLCAFHKKLQWALLEGYIRVEELLRGVWLGPTSDAVKHIATGKESSVAHRLQPYEDGDRSEIDGFTSCSNLGSNDTELDSLNRVAVYLGENALPKS
jgi:hypothetical protein